jgi:hypothetical protein
LTRPGIWHSVILDKYLRQHSVKRWLREETRSTSAASHFWRNLLKAKHLITSHICWRPGSGSSIILGQDNILGLDNSTIISNQLQMLFTQRTYGIYFRLRPIPDRMHCPILGSPVIHLDLAQKQRANGPTSVRISCILAYDSQIRKTAFIGPGVIDQVSSRPKIFMPPLQIRIGPLTLLAGKFISGLGA